MLVVAAEIVLRPANSSTTLATSVVFSFMWEVNQTPSSTSISSAQTSSMAGVADRENRGVTA